MKTYTYKDSIPKTIKWKPPTIKTIEDGNMDLTITIPLTEFFKRLAYSSFNDGIIAMIEFSRKHQADTPEEFAKALRMQLEEWSKY